MSLREVADAVAALARSAVLALATAVLAFGALTMELEGGGAGAFVHPALAVGLAAASGSLVADQYLGGYTVLRSGHPVLGVARHLVLGAVLLAAAFDVAWFAFLLATHYPEPDLRYQIAAAVLSAALLWAGHRTAAAFRAGVRETART